MDRNQCVGNEFGFTFQSPSGFVSDPDGNTWRPIAKVAPDLRANSIVVIADSASVECELRISARVDRVCVSKIGAGRFLEHEAGSTGWRTPAEVDRAYDWAFAVLQRRRLDDFSVTI